MILGLSVHTFTVIHVLISLVGIVAGVIVAFAMVQGKSVPGWTALALLDECASIATARGFMPGAAAMTRNRGMLTMPGSTFAASMLRDVERGAPTEADHILGDLIRRGGGDGGPNDLPLLRIAYAHLRAYDARRKRENASAPKP